MEGKAFPAQTDDKLFLRFKSSILSYGLRQILVTILALTTNIILTHYLLPDQFGQVAVITIILTIASLLADGGLGVYLIQRQAEVNEYDLSRVMTIQIICALSIVVACFLGAFGVDLFIDDGILGFMIAVAALSLPLQVVRGAVLLMMERSLVFNKVIRIELLEQVTYMVTAILLAKQGVGAWSIVIAQLLKVSVGALTGVFIGEVRFRFVKPAWDDDLKQGFRFGLHYQASSLITMARVSIIPLFIVPVFGLQAGGYVERALFFSSAPLSIIAAVQSRTMFPYISRIQSDRVRIRRFTEDSIYLSAVIDKILFLPFLMFARPIIEILFSLQWLPMLPLIYWLLAGNIVFGALAGTLYPISNGIGRSDYVSRINFAGLLLSWILTVPFTLLFGIIGVGIAAIILWGGIFWLKSKLTVDIGNFMYLRQNVKPIISVLLTWAAIEMIMQFFGMRISSVTTLIGWSVVAVITYIGIILLLDRSRLTQLLLKLKPNQWSQEMLTARK